MRLIEHRVKALRDSAIFDQEDQVAPACILWSDKDRQCENDHYLTLPEIRAARVKEAQT